MGIGRSKLRLTYPNKTCGDFEIFVESPDKPREKCVRCLWNETYLCATANDYYMTFERESAKIIFPYDLKNESKPSNVNSSLRLKNSPAGAFAIYQKFPKRVTRRKNVFLRCFNRQQTLSYRPMSSPSPSLPYLLSPSL